MDTRIAENDGERSQSAPTTANRNIETPPGKDPAAKNNDKESIQVVSTWRDHIHRWKASHNICLKIFLAHHGVRNRSPAVRKAHRVRMAPDKKVEFVYAPRQRPCSKMGLLLWLLENIVVFPHIGMVLVVGTKRPRFL